MDLFVEFLKFFLPLAALVLVVWLFLRMFFNREAVQRRTELEAIDRRNLLTMKTENAKVITPLRLQAFERAVLLLERITPDNLVMRMRRTDVGSGEMQGILLKSIRDEYDHNMSQQLYVSDEAWDMVKKAKEEVIQLIYNAGSDIKEGEQGIDLCRHVLERGASYENPPTTMAIKALKSEIKKLF
jgi:hypothetical protein